MSPTSRKPARHPAGVLLVLASILSPSFASAVCLYPPLTSTVPSSQVDVVANWGFAQTSVYWTAVGVRSAPGSNFDLTLHAETAAEPECVANPQASSTRSSGVDFVVGDFNFNATGTYYARVGRATGAGGATIEWDDDGDQLGTSLPGVVRSTGPSDVLEVWDTFLFEGLLYGIGFVPQGAANLKVLLFRNPGGGYWAPRSAAVVETTRTFAYLAPSSGWYGIVVVNDDGAPGSYTLDVREAFVGTGPGVADLPVRARLAGFAPNPAPGGTRIRFELARAAEVSFEVVNLAGRVMTRIPARSHPAGAWSEDWNGQAVDGLRAAPGVYFVRMRVDGRATDSGKLVLLGRN